jgi:hypothetical protein
MPDSVDIVIDDDVLAWIKENGQPESNKPGPSPVIFTAEEDKVLLALWGGTTKAWLSKKLGKTEHSLRRRYRELTASRPPSLPSR